MSLPCRNIVSSIPFWTYASALLLGSTFVFASSGCSSSGSNDDEANEKDDPETNTYSNPILNTDFPDPTVIMGADGTYYMYGTETMINGQRYNIQVAASTDLINWTWHGDAFPAGVSWAAQGRSYWAPHVLYDTAAGRYFMYFSAHHDANNGKCLTVVTSEDPLGPFEGSGDTLICGEGFVNIDPMAFDDPATGKKLLYWGSGGQPIKVRELADDRLSFREGAETTEVVFPRQDAYYSNLIEGSWVIYRDGTYFLFYSGDNCCGTAAHYAVLVARASTPFGPFERKGETDVANDSVILQANFTWNAPGHNSVVRDAGGDDWIVYHAINRDQPTRFTGLPGVYWDRRVVLMDRIRYSGGWPSIDGRQPSESSVMPTVSAAKARSRFPVSGKNETGIPPDSIR